jgi:hypothetical protein
MLRKASIGRGLIHNPLMPKIQAKTDLAIGFSGNPPSVENICKPANSPCSTDTGLPVRGIIHRDRIFKDGQIFKLPATPL